jgi:hypothetical protein
MIYQPPSAPPPPEEPPSPPLKLSELVELSLLLEDEPEST